MKINKSKRLKIITILSFLIIIICGTGITYSLFVSDTSLVANQKVAKFVFNAQKTDVIELPITNINPGDSIDYTFQVANNLNNKKSEVTINYLMTIKTYHFMPLKIELYSVKDNKETKILSCDETFSRTDNQLLCNTEIQTLSHNEKSADDYKLKIDFPEEYNSESYTELVDYIDIDIKSWQKTGKPVNYEE